MSNPVCFTPAKRLRDAGLAFVLGVGLAWPGSAYAATPDRPGLPTVAGPAAELPVRLTGIVAIPSQFIWRAIIADAAGHERTHGVGDRLPNGSVLSKIASDHIVVSHGGRSSVIGLVDNPTHSVSASTSVLRGGSDEGDQAAQPPSGGPAVPLIVRTAPVLLLQWLPIEPQMSGDLFVGYRIGDAVDPSVLNELGLEPGDVLTAINDVMLNGEHQDAWKLSSSPAPATLTLTVLRQERFLSLSY